MTDSLYTSTVMHLMHVFHSYVLWVKSTQQEDLFTSVGGTRPSRPHAARALGLGGGPVESLECMWLLRFE